MKEILKEVYSSILQHKMRSLLTEFGIAWGILILVVLLGAGNGFRSGILTIFSSYASNSIWVTGNWVSETTSKGMQIGSNIRFDDDLIYKLKCRFPQIKQISSEYNFQSRELIKYMEIASSFQIRGINKYRFRSPSKVKLDLKYFLSITKSNSVIIGDDTFTSSLNRVKDLCTIFKEIQKEYPFTWFCEGRVDVLSRHPEMISMMYEAGLRKLQIGIESGNQKVLDIYNKNITLEQIEFVVKEASKYEHLVVHGNLIIGNPKETIQEFLNSIDFVKRLFLISNFSLDIAKTNLTPFVGTPIRLNPEKYEIDILVEDFEFTRLGMVDIVCKPKSYSISEINNLNALTEKELQSFLNENMFKLPKSIITSKIKLYSKTFNGILASSSWNKTFNRLSSFQKYKKMI